MSPRLPPATPHSQQRFPWENYLKLETSLARVVKGQKCKYTRASEFHKCHESLLVTEDTAKEQELRVLSVRLDPSALAGIPHSGPAQVLSPPEGGSLDVCADGTSWFRRGDSTWLGPRSQISPIELISVFLILGHPRFFPSCLRGLATCHVLVRSSLVCN